MKKWFCIFLCVCLSFTGVAAAEKAAGSQNPYNTLLSVMVVAYEKPGNATIALLDAEAAALQDETAVSIAEEWKKVWLDPDYRLYITGEDDPAQLPVTGKHAFVVLGYELKDGGMTEELKGRCSAAAEAAGAFPGSVLVCSGGATGKNNPEKHTEAGLMKEYLSGECGIDPERIYTDDRAMDTTQNAINTLAILKELGIETMTIVTSSYHQRRGVTLYHTMAARYRAETGYSVEIIGNYCYPAATDERTAKFEHQITVIQMKEILELPSSAFTADK